jgi:hypothetical protein
MSGRVCFKLLMVLTLLLAATPRVPAQVGEPPTKKFAELLGPPTRVSPSRYPWYDASKDSMRPIDPPKLVEEWDLDWLSRLSQWISSLADVGFTALVWLLGGLVVGALVYLLLRLIANRRFATAPNAKQTAVSQVDRVDELPVRLAGVGDFLAAAEHCVREGRLDQAIVYYYSHQLLAMDRAGAIHLERGKTNRRYLREASKTLPSLTELFQQTIALFEESFFGHLPIDERRFSVLWRERHRFADLAEVKA